MGVDATHIIPHGFHALNDKQASVAFVKQTIENLKAKLYLYGFDAKFVPFVPPTDYEDDMCISFDIPFYRVEMDLYDGFWLINSYYRYHQIVQHVEGKFFLREIIYDIVRALGTSEAWHASEYETENGGPMDTPECTMDDWIAYVDQKFSGKVPEFSEAAVLAQGDVMFPDYEQVYHDTFIECRNKFETLQLKLPEYTLLGLTYAGKRFLRCVKDNGLYLIDSSTFKPLLGHPVDAVDCPFNGAEFLVSLDGRSAVFDGDGRRLTDYVIGEWKWKWCEIDIQHVSFRRVIFNETAGINFVV